MTGRRMREKLENHFRLSLVLHIDDKKMRWVSSIPDLGSLVRFEDLFPDTHGEWGHLNQLTFFDKLDGLLKA
jgi:hypothetical protein